MANVLALEKVCLLRDFPPYSHPSPCERRGTLAPAHPSRLFEHARMFSISGPNPPAKALLARLVHRMAILFVERVFRVILCVTQSASLVVRVLASRLRGLL